MFLIKNQIAYKVGFRKAKRKVYLLTIYNYSNLIKTYFKHIITDSLKILILYRTNKINNKPLTTVRLVKSSMFPSKAKESSASGSNL